MLASPLAQTLKATTILALLAFLALVTLPSSATASSPDAVTIGDLVWRENRFSPNGLQDATEIGLPFAPVNLYAADATTLISITNANAAGVYQLPVANAGTYAIEMPIPSYPFVGLRGSAQNVGADDTKDSDVHATGRSAFITVGATNDNTIDAGVYDSPDSITYCSGKQLTLTDWSDTFSLPKADPSLGILTGVYIRGTAGSSQNAALTNNAPVPQTFSYGGGSLNTLTLPNGTVITNSTSRTVTNIQLASGQTQTFRNLVDYRTADFIVNVLHFPLYQGDGGFDDYFSVPAQSQGTSTFIGGGNLVAVAQTQSYITVCVTYVFNAVLGVTLNSFEAQCRADDTIDVDWETLEEVDILGFNLLRGTSTEAQGERINQELIPAQATGGGGALYHWSDDSIVDSGTYYYWLESVDTSGNTISHGPVNASVPCTPTAVTISTLESTSASVGWGWVIAAGMAILSGVVLWRRRR